MSLVDDLIRDEGEVLHLYYCPAGKPTIGCGFNLAAGKVPEHLRHHITITPEGSRALLEWKLADTERELAAYLPRAWALSEVRRDVLLNMAYNLGINGLLKFRRFLYALQAGHFDLAADEMLDSEWARQVGDRAKRLADTMRRDA